MRAAKEASRYESNWGEIEETKMAWCDRIDTEMMNAREFPPRGAKGKAGRFRRPGNESENDLKIAIA